MEDIKEKYLQEMRRTVRFELSHYNENGKPVYEIYFDNMLIHEADINNKPIFYANEDYLVDCARTIANDIFNDFLAGRIPDAEELGAKSANLIDKKIASPFFKTLIYIGEKFLKMYSDGILEKVFKEPFKKIVKQIKAIYNDHYYNKGPKQVAEMIYQIQKEKALTQDTFNNISIFVFFYAGKNDNEFFKTCSKHIHDLAKKDNTGSIELEMSAQELLDALKVYHNKKIKEDEIYPFKLSEPRKKSRFERTMYIF